MNGEMLLQKGENRNNVLHALKFIRGQRCYGLHVLLVQKSGLFRYRFKFSICQNCANFLGSYKTKLMVLTVSSCAHPSSTNF